MHCTLYFFFAIGLASAEVREEKRSKSWLNQLQCWAWKLQEKKMWMLSHVPGFKMQLRVTVWISALCILAMQKTPPVILPLWPVLYQLPPSLHTPCGTVKSQTHQWTIIDEMDLLWPWAFMITWKMLKGIAMKSWSAKQMATRSILSLAERRTFHPELPKNDFLGHWNFHSNIQQYQANKVGRF